MPTLQEIRATLTSQQLSDDQAIRKYRNTHPGAPTPQLWEEIVMTIASEETTTTNLTTEPKLRKSSSKLT